jgi:hypothetical protein
MANEEHFKILEQGVKVWNKWRKDNPEINPNLNNAILSEANLCKINLVKADLRNTYFKNANLSRANLREADLYMAYVSYANLSYANLSKANLTTARLVTARLINTNLDGANLTGAHVWETQRSGWSIKNVICEYIYWDRYAKEKTYYQPGDFERLFSEQNKIKLFYKDGANLLEIATLPSIIKNLEEKHLGYKLSFQSIEETSGGAIATLVLEESKDIAVEKVEAEAERDVQKLRQALQCKEIDIAQLQGEVRALDRAIRNMMRDVQPVNYINNGQVQAMGDGAQAHDNTSNQIVNAENSSVDTQIQGERNIAVDGDASDNTISTGDKDNE